MERMLLCWKILLFLCVLHSSVRVFVQRGVRAQISPRGGVDCSKFASEYNDAERKICQAKD